MVDPDDVTSGYRRNLLDARDRTGAAVAAGLVAVDLDLAPGPLRAALGQWAMAAEPVVSSGQTIAAGLSSAYMGAWLLAAGATAPAPTTVDLVARVGSVPDDVPGSSLADALMRAGIAVLWRLRSAPRATAVRYGQYAATRVAWTAVQDNATGVLGEMLAKHPQVIGWRRITSVKACDRCVQAAGRSYKPRTQPLERRHPSCRCTQGPVLGTS